MNKAKINVAGSETFLFITKDRRYRKSTKNVDLRRRDVDMKRLVSAEIKRKVRQQKVDHANPA